MPDPLKMLFLCTGNSARSQMAEDFARHYGQGWVEASSAGMAPSQLNPHAVRVMQEKGIDISGPHSKVFDWDPARQMDVVVTVCGHANESCPVLPPEVQRLHCTLEDPAAATGSAAEILATLRAIRNQIEGRMRELLAGITPPA